METIILILIYIYLNPFLDVCLIYDWLLNISRMGHNSVNWLKKKQKNILDIWWRLLSDTNCYEVNFSLFAFVFPHAVGNYHNV